MARKKALSPTLWRTCRVLMNETRLRLFQVVVEHADELNVSQIARLLEIPQPQATNGLRALQSRGLIGVRRERLSVFYNLNPDRSLPDASDLQAVFVTYFQSGDLDENWTARTMSVLKAFTHFNRLEMIRHLFRGAATKHELEAASGVVVKTINHHLRFLRLAGLLESEENPGNESLYGLREPDNPIAQELLRQLRTQETSYYNSAKGTESNLRLVRDKDGSRRIVALR